MIHADTLVCMCPTCSCLFTRAAFDALPDARRETLAEILAPIETRRCACGGRPGIVVPENEASE